MKDPVVEPEAMVTDAGTVRLGLSLASDISNPPAGTAVSTVTAQVEDPFPWREEGVHDSDSK
jgi:hypothetical protein